jgi:hypothetical protein
MTTNGEKKMLYTTDKQKHVLERVGKRKKTITTTITFLILMYIRWREGEKHNTVLVYLLIQQTNTVRTEKRREKMRKDC